MIWLMENQKIQQKEHIRQSFWDKALKIASDPKYDGYHRELASMVYKFFDEKSSGSGIVNEANYQLANELHEPIILKFKKRKVY